MQLSINLLVLFSIVIDLKKVLSSSDASLTGGFDLDQVPPAVASSTSSFLLFTNSVHSDRHHNASRHKNKPKKKSPNRNRAAVHRTTTPPLHSTTNSLANSNENDQSDDSLYSKVKQPNSPAHVNLTVKVGESVVLNCAINSSYGHTPGVIWMQGKVGNVLTLDTGRITADGRFEIIQQPLQMITSSSEPDLNNGSKRGLSHGGHYRGNSRRLRHQHAYRQVTQTDFNYFHLRINNVQIDDENEYACETSMIDEQSNVHALFNLQVTQSPSFIEQLTSETNNALFEYTDTILKCFATGKPAPKIRWYQISEENEILKDLLHESTTLSLKNVSKSDPHKYECVASNGILPSVSKKFSLTVYYTPSVVPLNENVYQAVGQSVLLGCLVSSNPESTVVWYRKNKTNGTNEFELIDISQSRYQTHKFKQTNQTVYYFKIKHLERLDYTTYKCEVTNLVGKSEATIEIHDLQETEQYNTNANNKSPKTMRKNQSISYVMNNPYLDELMKSDESDMDVNYSGQLDEENESKSKEASSNGFRKKQPQVNMRKNNNNNNKTFHKYQINKSNSIQETENSLQRINDILENGSTLSTKSVSFHSISVFFLVVALNLIYCC